MRTLSVCTLLFAALAAAPVPAAEPCGWYGIRAYVSDAEGAWTGATFCKPCALFCADVRAHNRHLRASGKATWRVGFNTMGDNGTSNDIQLVTAKGGGVPVFVPVVNGVENRDGAVLGYHGLAEVFSLHPLLIQRSPARSGLATLPDDEWNETPRPTPAAPAIPAATVEATPFGPPVVEEVPTTLPDDDPATCGKFHSHEATTTVAYGAAQWTWPGGSIQALRSHLAREHGWGAAYVNSLTPQQLQAIHDRCHNTGRVTPYGKQRWPVAGNTQRGPDGRPCPGSATYAARPYAQQPVYQQPYAPWPVYAAAPPVYAQQPVVVQQPVYLAAPRPRYYRPARSSYSAGFNIGGLRMGTYSSGSACPGGFCPN